MRLIALCSFLAARILAGDLSAFAYDKNLPLDIQEHQIAIRSGIRVARLSYSVAPAVRTDCLLVTPSQGASKTGAIVWMHSSGYYEQLPDAMLLAQAGAVSRNARRAFYSSGVLLLMRRGTCVALLN